MSYGLLVGCVTIALFAAYYIDEQYRAMVHEAQHTAEAIAARAQADTAEVFGRTSGVMEELGAVYMAQRASGDVQPSLLKRVMTEHVGGTSSILALALAEPDGSVVAAAGDGATELIAQIRDAPGTERRFVGKPIAIGDGEVIEPIGYRIGEGTGTTVAFVLGGTRAGYLAAHYQTYSLGRNGVILVQTDRGDIVSSYGLGTAQPNDQVPPDSVVERIAGASTMLAIPSLGPLRSVDLSVRVDGLPLQVFVHIDGADFLGAWERTRNHVAAIALALIAMTFFTMRIWQGQIAQARENEIALRQAKTDADEANAAKSRFLAHMSHEFRTPLNAIMGFSDIIKNKVMGEDVAPIYTTYADHIHRSGAHLLSIVNDILDIAKIESGSETLQRHTLDVATVVRSAVSFVEGVAAQYGLKLTAEIASGLPALNGDERFVRQVLINLLTNAIKFSMPEGTVTAAARMTPRDALEIVVIDHGPGIDPAIVRRIGEPFLQGDPALSRVGRGTGLGLSICKHYMTLLGGELLISSAPAEGTTAIMHFPAELLMRSNEAA